MPAPAPATPPGAPTQQPTFGQTPATQATPNRGYEAAGMQRLGLVVKQLTDLLPMLGVSSDPGQAVLKAINALSKHVPPGSGSAAGERQSIEKMAMQNAQNNAQMQAMRQRMQGGGQGGAQQPPGMAA